MRVRVGTVSKERRGTLRVKVRAGMVRKTVLRVLRALRVYKRALYMGVRAVTLRKGSKTSLWVSLQVWVSLRVVLRVLRVYKRAL